jgi:hypothetical protein
MLKKPLFISVCCFTIVDADFGLGALDWFYDNS